MTATLRSDVRPLQHPKSSPQDQRGLPFAGRCRTAPLAEPASRARRGGYPEVASRTAGARTQRPPKPPMAGARGASRDPVVAPRHPATLTAKIGPSGMPAGALFRRRRARHALEVTGSCIMLVGFLVLAFFG